MTHDELYQILRYISHPKDAIELIWGQPFDGETEKINTTKSVSLTSPTTEESDQETAEQKLKWLTILLVTESCDPVFTDYWLRLARRNLRLGLPLMTPEPELNPVTEESSATASSENEADFATKPMTANEIMAGKMAKDLRQIREQILAVGKYPTNLLGGGGWDTLVRMYADSERLDSHLCRRWNTPTPNPHNQ